MSFHGASTLLGVTYASVSMASLEMEKAAPVSKISLFIHRFVVPFFVLSFFSFLGLFP